MKLSQLINHPHVARYLCSFVVGPKLWALQPLMHYGEALIFLQYQPGAKTLLYFSNQLHFLPLSVQDIVLLVREEYLHSIPLLKTSGIMSGLLTQLCSRWCRAQQSIYITHCMYIQQTLRLVWKYKLYMFSITQKAVGENVLISVRKLLLTCFVGFLFHQVSPNTSVNNMSLTSNTQFDLLVYNIMYIHSIVCYAVYLPLTEQSAPM